MAASQLDEERREFESFKGSTKNDINVQLEALEEERRRVTDETSKFEAYRSEALNQLRLEQSALETERSEFDTQRSAMLSQLQSKRETLDAEITQHVKENARAESSIEEERHKLSVMQKDMEKLEQELTNQKWRLVKERKHYEEERKHLSRLLLGMGEKMSNNGFASVDDEISMLEQEMMDTHKDAGKRELAVYSDTVGDANLMGIVPLYPSTTVGDIRSFIADKFLSTPLFMMKKKNATVRITHDSYAAIDFFKVDDYVVTTANTAPTESNPASPSVSVTSVKQ